MTDDQSKICERIRRVGYAQGSQVNLYGQTFELVSDPFVVGEGVIFLDGLEQRSGHVRRIRVPLPIVAMAKREVLKAA
jgi:hypothetical protein